MGCFVISQDPENNAVIQTMFVVVLEKGFFFKQNTVSLFLSGLCNFIDLFLYPNTRTKIKKVKKHNRTSFKILLGLYSIVYFILQQHVTEY